jgi:transposase
MGRRCRRSEWQVSTLPRFVWRGLVTASKGEGSVEVADGICFVGLDVHARKTAGAAVQLGSGEVFRAQIRGAPTEAIGWLQSLPGPVRAVYEAGPTGFGLARAARAAGVEVMVCSPGAIARQPGDRIKTDTRDALKLARLLAAGQLRAVTVPTVELEALRDLVRAREDLRGDLMAARHRISKQLLRHGLLYPGPGIRGSPSATPRGLVRSGSPIRWRRSCSASISPVTRCCSPGATGSTR